MLCRVNALKFNGRTYVILEVIIPGVEYIQEVFEQITV
jgi:hypothetical protein